MDVSVKAKNRTLEVFEFFARERRAASLTEIARGIRMPMSSCFNLIKSLQAIGFLYSVDGKRQFYPTRKLFDMGSAILEGDPWIWRVTAELEKLRSATHETVVFGARQGDHVVLLRVLEGFHQIRFNAKAGDVVPLLASAQGRAILSQLPANEREQIVREAPLDKWTKSTITDRKILLRLLDDAQKAGYVLLRGEVIADLDAIAMPVKINNEVHSIVIAGPSARMRKNLAAHRRHLAAACAALGDALHSPNELQSPRRKGAQRAGKRDDGDLPAR
jgi:DNA-binding IclR family transcriptional regulator